MSDYVIRGIPAPLVERMWTFAEPYVKRALDHSAGEVAPADLKQSCIDRDTQLWLVSSGTRIVGACITEIVSYPRKKHCLILTVAGSNFAEWALQLDALLEQFARQHGCDAIEGRVRRGFVHKLAPFAYKHLHSVVVRKLAIINADKESIPEVPS